jgi:3-phytase
MMILIIKNLRIIILSLTYAILFLASCNTNRRPNTKEADLAFPVTAQAETKPVPRDAASDAADDPAIWINFLSPDSSRIIGTDKKGGLAVYDLSGRELFYYNTGFMNNADIRYRFPLGSDSVDIITVSNRTDQSVDIYKINSDGSLEVVHKHQLKSMLKEEVYGLCLYRSRITKVFYVFVNGKDGAVEQWELFASGDKIDGRIVRNLKLSSQVEGMVTDDETGTLFIGEEDNGIWKYNAEPSGQDKGELIPMSGEKDNLNIKSDIEGLAIYKLSNDEGYLIASSQGNDSYAVFERKPPHKYLGSFKIVDGESIDGAEETDGLDVISFPVGEKYLKGLLVVQDGLNKDKGISAPQNFKIVRWDSIAMKFSPPLYY